MDVISYPWILATKNKGKINLCQAIKALTVCIIWDMLYQQYTHSYIYNIPQRYNMISHISNVRYTTHVVMQ